MPFLILVVRTHRAEKVGKEKKKMADFEIIETQERLDEILGKRLKSEREKAAKAEEALRTENERLSKQVADYEAQFTEINAKLSTHNDELAKLTAENQSYKLKAIKHQIAHQNGLPFELADRLTGEDEEALKKDAEALKRYVAPRQAAPLATQEVEPQDDKNAQYRELARKVTERN